MINPKRRAVRKAAHTAELSLPMSEVMVQEISIFSVLMNAILPLRQRKQK